MGLLLLLLNNLKLISQTLLPTANYAFETQLPFNENYIKQQKIKSITFDIIDKKDLQVAEDKGLQNYYEFNELGILSRYYYTTISKTIQKEYFVAAKHHKRKQISAAHSYTKNEFLYDTISTTYFFNESKSIKLKRYNDGDFYESYYYNYNQENEIISEKRFKETNISPLKQNFKLGNQLVISDETYVYQKTGKFQLKKTCQNNEGRPYKDVIYNYNSQHQITSINEQYIVAWIIQQSEFEYNAKNQLIKASYNSNSNGNYQEMRTYEYDENDCLLTEKQFKNGVMQKEVSYVTDTFKRLTSYIIREADKKTIRIVKLFYKFY